MPTKRQILEKLKRDELLVILDQCELEVPDRRVRDDIVDALARSPRVRLDEALVAFPRDTLKEVCRDLGLDDSGREKERIIARLLGRDVHDAKPEGGRSRGTGRRAAADVPSAGVTEGPLTRQALERYLWSAADILRGSIDSSDYKSFIFGLLFLKRLSDRFEEECEALNAEGANPEDPDEHQFFVPKRARWSEIQKVATGLGEVLNKASSALEDANASLQGVLAGIDYNDERRLGDAKHRDKLLHQLVQHFAQVNLRNSNLSEPDMLGRAYEYLIEKFADDAGKKGGEFYTPHMVVKLIVELLEPKEGMRICDPTCGSGGMLIQSAKYIAEHGGDPRNVSLFGQEKNLGTWAICKMNMLLHGFPDSRIEKGDTLAAPKLLDHGELMLFDRVIANPPFSDKNWSRPLAENDPFGRYRFGVPPKTKGDLAFVQHMVATLNMQGRLGVVMPHGVLFRGSTEGDIRKGLIEEDLIEAVIGLPPNLFYGTGIPAAILVINRAKPKARKGKVLFIEASREFREGSNQNYLRDEDVTKIGAAAHAFVDVERYARVVPAEEIAKHDFNLNIGGYVATAAVEAKADVASAIAKLRVVEQARDAAKVVMDGFLAELGYDA